MSSQAFSPASSPNNVVRIAFIVGAVIVLGLLVWQLTEVWVLIFAAMLFAVILRSLAAQVEHYTPIPAPWSLMLAILSMVLLGAAFVLLLGLQIREQFADLLDQLPAYIADIGDRLGIEDPEQQVLQRLEEVSVDSGLLGLATAYTSSTISAVVSFGLMLIIGVYLAANPEHYLRGVLKLVPTPYTEKVSDTLVNIGHALRQWLAGQFIIMVIVGTLVSLGLTLIGLPSALALGFMAGLAEFIPILGPLLAAAPAILIAFSEDRETLFWVIGLFVLVQQLEGYVISPLVQRKAVHLPPVVTILSIVGFGILLGLPGIVMAGPLAVTLMVAVERLYVRETLGIQVDVPGARDGG
jgi:predicted PurR-regulated permease PerM